MLRLATTHPSQQRLDQIAADAAAGRRWRARAALEELLADDVPFSPALAQLTERLGLTSQATALWQQQVQRDPDDIAAWRSLLALHSDQGQQERAEGCRQALRRLGALSSPPAPPAAPPPPTVADADLIRMAHLFAGREEVHARMWRGKDGRIGYSPAASPLSPEVIAAHLSGELTAGVYLLRADETVSLIVLDLDADKPALQAALGDRDRLCALQGAIHDEGLRLLAALRDLGLDPLLEDSGYKGRHLWIFLDAPTPALEAHAVAQHLAVQLVPASSLLKLEAFPKQARLSGKGYGNLVKLPLGIHRRSGRRAVLLDDDGQPIADAHARLRAVRRTPLPAVAPLPAPVAAPPVAAPPVTAAPLPAPWCEADFDLSPQVSPVLAGCPVLQRVIERILDERTLTRDAALVLKHSLGHLPDGVKAAHYLLDQVPDFPRSERLKRILRGNPTSCEKICSRLPVVAAARCRGCEFPPVPGAYPHPIRHLTGPLPTAPTPTDPAALLARFARQQARLQRLHGELDALRAACVVALQSLPEPHLDGWHLEDIDGLPALVWSGEE